MISIQLVTSTVNNLTIKHFPIENEEMKSEDDRSFDLSHQVIFPENDNRSFVNSFKLHLEHPGEFILDIEYFSWFHTSEDIDDDFKKSHFIGINAPAIAFPYLRSVISTITLLSGYPAAILPTINFVQLHKEE
jgi:preprotein translocase subunit SecB